MIVSLVKNCSNWGELQYYGLYNHITAFIMYIILLCTCSMYVHKCMYVSVICRPHVHLSALDIILGNVDHSGGEPSFHNT